jgi:hypothetical protein
MVVNGSMQVVVGVRIFGAEIELDYPLEPNRGDSFTKGGDAREDILFY